tara:strand:+ start:216 stop:488 length:273 start_codon:yes stop_codon:yes gene_type:complete
MCVGPFKPKAPAITIPEPPVIPEEEAAKESRRRIRAEQQRETTKLKEEAFESRVASAYGRRGRRSLLTGKSGGAGYDLSSAMKSKTKLGA